MAEFARFCDYGCAITLYRKDVLFLTFELLLCFGGRMADNSFAVCEKFTVPEPTCWADPEMKEFELLKVLPRRFPLRI